MAKDLLPFMRSDAEAFSMDKVLRQAVVVPESKRVDRMLKEFRSQRYHMAIVIDEFGGVSGLVTIEDILELICLLYTSKYAARRVEDQERSEAWWPQLHSFAVGLPGSPDLKAAQELSLIHI